MSVTKKTWTVKKIIGSQDEGPPDIYYETHVSYTGDAAADHVDAYFVPASTWAVNISTGAGNDRVFGSLSLSETIDGGAGDDWLVPFVLGSGRTIDGGTGIDTVQFGQYSRGVAADLVAHRAAGIGLAGATQIFNVENLVGSQFSDIFTGDKRANFLAGQDGDDSIDGGAGNDSIDGGNGNDVLTGGAGNDSITGDTGNDRFVQDSLIGKDSLNGGDGFDTADYSSIDTPGYSIRADLAAGTIARQHTVDMEQYEQTIRFEVSDIDTIRSIEAVIGSPNSDFLNGVGVTAGPVGLYGKGGNDVLFGSVFNDTLNGGAGNDAIWAGAGDDRIEQDSWSGNDTINGGAGMDVVDYSGLAAVAGVESHIVVNLGIDRIEKFQSGVVTGTDRINDDVEQVIGTAFNDVLYGDAKANQLFGGAGNDTFVGAAGNDLLDGGSGNDLLVGGAGNDTIIGGTGNDLIRLDGGGDDTFIFDANFGQDTITRVNAADAAGRDVVQFNGIDTANILFKRLGDDLSITIIGNPDTLTLAHWYDVAGDANFDVDQFKAGDVVLNADMVAHSVTITGAPPVSMAELFGQIT